MPPLSGSELEESLAAAGNRLLHPPSSTDELLSLLDRIEELLSKVEQSPAKSMQSALSPLMNALVVEKLLKHSDTDVKVGVASCISEITRITAPEAPYDDDTMKDVFQLIVSSFENLSDTSSRSHEKRISILEIVAKVRSCVIMLDLECDQMIIEMFQYFLKAIRDYHSEVIFASMETIMTLVLEESEDISSDLLGPILATLKKNNDEAVLPVAKKLAESVIRNTADKIRPYLAQAVKSLDASLDDLSEVVSSLYGEKNGIDGHSNECNSKDQLAAKVGVGETNSKDEDPTVARSPESIVRDGINEIGTEETVTDANSLKIDDSNHQHDAKAMPDTVLDDHVAQESVKSEAELENAGLQAPCEHEIPDKDVHVSATEVKPVEVAESLGEVKEIQLSQSEAPETEAVDVASPAQSGSLPNESQCKEDSLEKRKENLVSGETVAVDIAPDKTYEGESKSVAKKRRSGKKKADKTADMGKTLTDKGTSNNADGNASDSVAKSLDQTEKRGNASDKMEDASSLRKEDGKKSARVKPSLEKDVPKSSAKEDRRKDSATSSKSTKDQGIQEETPRVNAKRKRTPGTEKASETTEFGENLVGSRVKVWWPKDRMFYEGVIESFDSAKKKHKVLYVDGDEEVLNLRRQRWEFVKADLVADGEQDDESSKNEASSDIKTKKKGNANSESSRKRRKMDGSPKGKLNVAATKSGGKSSKYDSQAESESKQNNLKPSKKSGDDTVKSKDHSQKLRGKLESDSTKTSGGSKDDDDEKTPSHSKQVGQKSAKSKGKKTPQSGKMGGARMAKSSSAKAKETTDKTNEKPHDSDKLPEMAKGKSTDNATKSQESEAKTGKKRRKRNI